MIKIERDNEKKREREIRKRKIATLLGLRWNEKKKDLMIDCWIVMGEKEKQDTERERKNRETQRKKGKISFGEVGTN